MFADRDFDQGLGFEVERRRMVDEQLRQRGIRDQRVLDAMSRVPRHVFIDPEDRQRAYLDQPVGTGFGSTISQPFMVAIMLEALRVRPDCNVLEVGTGTGYEAALLGELAASVVTIERVPQLAVEAALNLETLGTRNVDVLTADGSLGFPPRAPYDRIIVAAGAPEIPEALFAQLAEGGLLLVPVGSGDTQMLMRIQRIGVERRVETLDACRFVPLIGEQGHRGEE